MDFMHYKAWLYITFWDNLECNIQWRLWISRHFKYTLDSSFISQISRTYMHIFKTFEFFESNRSDLKLDSKILESRFSIHHRIQIESNPTPIWNFRIESTPNSIQKPEIRFDSIRFNSLTSLIRRHSTHPYHRVRDMI